jgi:hypothetical protein
MFFNGGGEDLLSGNGSTEAAESRCSSEEYGLASGAAGTGGICANDGAPDAGRCEADGR